MIGNRTSIPHLERRISWTRTSNPSISHLPLLPPAKPAHPEWRASSHETLLSFDKDHWFHWQVYVGLAEQVWDSSATALDRSLIREAFGICVLWSLWSRVLKNHLWGQKCAETSDAEPLILWPRPTHFLINFLTVNDLVVYLFREEWIWSIQLDSATLPAWSCIFRACKMCNDFSAQQRSWFCSGNAKIQLCITLSTSLCAWIQHCKGHQSSFRIAIIQVGAFPCRHRARWELGRAFCWTELMGRFSKA